MSVLATDNFNRADASDLGSSWTNIGDASLSISSNAAAAPNGYGTNHVQTYTGVTCPADHYSQAVINNMTAFYHGVICRAADANNYYAFGVNPNAFGGAGTTYRLWKVVAGSPTSLGTGTGTAASGDTFYIEAQGTTIKGFANGVEKVSVTDSDLSGGNFGLVVYSTAAAARFDDWEGGDFAASGPVIPVRMAQTRMRTN